LAGAHAPDSLWIKLAYAAASERAEKKIAALSLAETKMTMAEEQSLPSLTERTLRQRATPAKIAVVCQFTYLTSRASAFCSADAALAPPGKLISGHDANTFGVFKVDQQLKHLKQAAREHVNSQGCTWCVEAEYVKQANAQSQRRAGARAYALRTPHARGPAGYIEYMPPSVPVRRRPGCHRASLREAVGAPVGRFCCPELPQ
jgi:hypothetical protein